jgi:hypothetical protein
MIYGTRLQWKMKHTLLINTSHCCLLLWCISWWQKITLHEAVAEVAFIMTHVTWFHFKVRKNSYCSVHNTDCSNASSRSAIFIRHSLAKQCCTGFYPPFLINLAQRAFFCSKTKVFPKQREVSGSVRDHRMLCRNQVLCQEGNSCSISTDGKTMELAKYWAMQNLVTPHIYFYSLFNNAVNSSDCIASTSFLILHLCVLL